MEDQYRKTVIVILAVISILVLAEMGGFPLSSVGYSTASEGAKAAFYGVKSPDGVKYTNTERGDASLARFDTTLGFDPDEIYRDMPNLVGEMTIVYIPSAEWIPPDEVNRYTLPSSWWRYALDWDNPVKTYTWEVPQPDGGKILYRMEEYLTMWFVSISSEFDSGPDQFNNRDETNDQRYSGWEVWVEFDVSPTWYFEGAQETYFAISSVEVANVELGGRDQFKSPVDPRSDVSVSPGSVGTPLFLYYAPFGGDPAKATEELRTFKVRGATLNPAYFRDKVYGSFTLNNFGTEESGNALTGMKAQGDVVTYAFKVRQFTVGEWRVQPNRDNPTGYGRTAQTKTTRGLLPDLSGLFSGPGGILAGIIILGIAILGILSFSGLLPTLLALILTRKRGEE